MAKYLVIAIQVLLKNNELAKAGDVVDGSKFPDLKHSIDGGYIKKEGKKSKKAEKKAIKESEKKAAEEAELLAKSKKENIKKGKSPEKKAIRTEEEIEAEVEKVEGMKKEELVDYVEENKLSVDTELNKPELKADIIAVLKGE